MTAFTPFNEGPVRGFLHRADGPDALVLTHGAGGNCEMPLLAAVADAFAAAGVSVLRCDLPFRQKRRNGPPPPSAASEDRAGLKCAAGLMRGMLPGLVFLGGQSYGGRQASMLAADEPELVQGLLLLSYPLHPPGKPDRLRTDHFPRLRIPALFIHGSRDPFGSAEEFREALQSIPGPAVLVEIQGAGHDLARGNFDIANLVVKQFQGFERFRVG
ncbi:MAG: alpha/beta hydrolase [Acidobacteriota bacterium]|nr:alpha/beta hydrolase [Acidobacteriota bacterium]